MHQVNRNAETFIYDVAIQYLEVKRTIWPFFGNFDCHFVLFRYLAFCLCIPLRVYY